MWHTHRPRVLCSPPHIVMCRESLLAVRDDALSAPETVRFCTAEPLQDSIDELREALRARAASHSMDRTVMEMMEDLGVAAPDVNAIAGLSGRWRPEERPDRGATRSATYGV